MSNLPRLPLTVALALACTMTAAAQTAPPLEGTHPPVVVTAAARADSLRFTALGPVVRLRLEVYDASGTALLYDSGLAPGNLRDWGLVDRAGARLADGSYTYVVTARDAAGRLSLKQGVLMIEGGAAALSLGASEPSGTVAHDASAPEAATESGGGAATLATHDGRDGAVTATQGALTLRTGDLLAGAEQEHVRVTPDGRVGIGTTAPEATLDVAGTVRAQGGFRFSDGSTLDSAGGRLRLTTAEGEETPAPSAAGTGTLGRLAKWLETGGAGNLGDSLITETAAGNIGISNPNPTTKLSVLGAPGAELRFDKGAQSITPVLNVISQPASTTLGGAAGLAAGGGGTSFNFSDNLPFFIVRDTKANVVNNNLGFGTPLFTVQPSGNVGVGTTSPTSKLHVAGAVNVTGLRTVENATSPHVIGGFAGNSVTAGVVGAAIGGGGQSGSLNTVTDDFGTVGGGGNNRAGNNFGTPADGAFATVGGGFSNTAIGSGTVGGGSNNMAGGGSTIGGGRNNTALGGSTTIGGGNNNNAGGGDSTIGGGNSNTALGGNATIGGGLLNNAGGSLTTIGGGQSNTTNGQSSTVPGGSSNAATGDFSFAAGRRAKANHAGAFVWADSTDADFTSTATNQFLIRAGGGVGIGTTSPAAPLHVQGGPLLTSTDAGGSAAITVGQRFRDNSIIAWGRILNNGAFITNQVFGVASTTRDALGVYTINLSSAPTTQIAVSVIAEVDSPPTTAATARLVTFDRLSPTMFRVFITNGSFVSVDNEFFFIVTGR